MLPPKHSIPTTSQRAQPQTRLDLNRIRSAVPKIAPVFRNTPQYACPALGEALDCELIVKLETANPLRLADDAGLRSAVCASVGNLGQALAWSGRKPRDF